MGTAEHTYLVGPADILASACAEGAGLVDAYWRSPPPSSPDTAATEPLDPTALRAALAKLHRMFGKPGPHDAHEAMVLILKTLHDALARTPPVAQSIAALHVDADSWAKNNKGNYSILTEVFQGQLESTVTSPGGYTNVTHQHFWCLTLPVDDVASVPQAVARYLAPETVDGYRLDDGTVTPVTVSKAFVYLPLVLVVCLSRFDARRMKQGKFVDYGVALDLSGSVRGNTSYKYSLFGVCLHSGESAADGHYSALVEHGGRWWHVNDETSTPVESLNLLIQRDAYVLLYKRDLDY